MAKQLLKTIALSVTLSLSAKAQNTATLTPAMQQIANPKSTPDWIYFKYPQQIHPDSVFTQYKTAFGLGINDRMDLIKNETDELGIKHQAYQQYYNNIPVDGGIFIVHSQNNQTTLANGKMGSFLSINTTPVISGTDAINYALAYVNASVYMWQDSLAEANLKTTTQNVNATYYPKPELVITLSDYEVQNIASNYLLAYKLTITSKSPYDSKVLYINAINGTILKENSLIANCLPTTVQTMYSSSQLIHTSKITDASSPYYNKYKLENNCNGTIISTRYNNFLVSGDVYHTSNNWNTWGPNATANSAVMQAQWGTEKMYDYMSDVLGIHSYDNNGGKMTAVIRDDLEPDNSYYNFTDNQAVFHQGGLKAAPYTFLCSIDGIGHEWGHGITENLIAGGLSYPHPTTTEINGVHEAYSDIWGTLFEFYMNGGNITNWKIGESFYNYNGRNFLRDFSDPSLANDPDTYMGTNYFNNMDGHHTGQVIAHWFYLLAMGGNGDNHISPTYHYDVSGIGLDKSVKILFKSYRYLFTGAMFFDTRNATIQAAIDLYGGCSTEVMQVKEAWNAVGMYEQIPSFSYCFSTTDVNCSSALGAASCIVFNEPVSNYSIAWFTMVNGMPNDLIAENVNTVSNLAPGNYCVQLYNITEDISEWFYFTISTNEPSYDYPNGLTINSSTQPVTDANNDGIIRVKGPVYVNANYTIANQIWQFANDFTLDPDNIRGIPPSGIVVNLGKTLTLNNVKFTGACGMWQGIQVWGTYNYQTGALNQGKLIMQNNSEIRNAHIGVALYRTHDLPASTNNYGLGLIQTSGNCKFINNAVGVAFNAHIVNRTTIPLPNNNSVIKDCQFFSDASLLDPKYGSLPSNYFIKVYNNNGVTISGNTFSCNNLIFDVKDRGTAIRSYNASYNVGTNSFGTGNTFTNLTKGIDSYATGGIKNINITGNTFNKVQQAITTAGTNYDNITANAFYIPDKTTIDTWGVYLNGTQGFKVSDANSFNKCTGCTNTDSKGVIVIDGGTFAGTISKNTFNGLHIASQSEGDNGNATAGGLQFKCNTYTNNDFAISVSPQQLTTPASLAPQGDGCGQTDNRPVNKFPDGCTGNFEDINSTISFDYFENLSNVNIATPACVKTGATYVTLNQCSGLPQDNYCESGTGGNPPNIQAIGQQLNSEQNPIKKRQLLHEYVLNILLNGNMPNKEVLIKNILEAWNTVESRKILVPVYIEQGELVKARNTLNQIPQDNTENINYHKLYNELITLGQNNKTVFDINPVQQQTITDVANSSTFVRYHAQSILEVTGKGHFERTPETITLSTARLAYFNADEPNEIRSNMYDARLGNNYPNPYVNSTLIPYSLPQDVQNASLNITDVTGRLIATYDLQEGERSIEFDASDLKEGVYYYTMYVNKNMVSTKKMIIIKQ